MKGKVSNQYAGAVLDINGGFYKHLKKYPFFRMIAKDKRQIRIINSIVPLLIKKDVAVKKYVCKDFIQYLVYGKKDLVKLKKYMKEYCLTR